MVSDNVRLGDIATVTYDLPDKKFRIRAMSKPALALAIMKEGDANTLEVADRVNAVLDDLQANPRLDVIEMAVFFDQGAVIMESLSTLTASGRVGGIIALCVLFFFLQASADDSDRDDVDPAVDRHRSDRDVLRRGEPQHPDTSGTDDLRRPAGRQLGRGGGEHLPALQRGAVAASRPASRVPARSRLR